MAPLLLALAGCLPTPGPGDTGERSPGPVPSAVLGEAELREEGGMLLDALIRRVPTMRVRFDAPCPVISLRGSNTAPGLTDPEVYVDGVRGADTCILATLASADVRLVEVYSQGVTGRPGYVTSARGLILVFRRVR